MKIAVAPLKALLLMAALAVSAIASAPKAHADVVWTFHDVTFNDGTSLTGSFTVDVYGGISTWDVTGINGTLTGYRYTPVINPGGTFPISNYVVFNRPEYNGYLNIVFADPLTVAGINPIVTGGPSYECGGFASQLGACTSSSIRYVTGGFASAVPEPSTWAMLIAGFAGLAIMAHRRRRRATETA